MKCKICGKEFELKKEDMYLVLDCSLKILINRNEYEAFNCPHCGCQNVVNERYTSINIDHEIEEIIENSEMDDDNENGRRNV